MLFEDISLGTYFVSNETADRFIKTRWIEINDLEFNCYNLSKQCPDYVRDDHSVEILKEF